MEVSGIDVLYYLAEKYPLGRIHLNRVFWWVAPVGWDLATEFGFRDFLEFVFEGLLKFLAWKGTSVYFRSPVVVVFVFVVFLCAVNRFLHSERTFPQTTFACDG
jgi:hypothetical protein